MQAWLKDNHLKFLLLTNGLILLLAALFSSGQFLDPYNLQNMAKQMPELGLLALAMMLAMISGNGGIDLSAIGIANLAAVSAGLVANAVAANNGWLFMVVFVAVALLVGSLCGVVNGYLIAYQQFSPILATLGTQLVFVGFAVALSGGPAVRLGYVEPFVQIGNGALLGVPIPAFIFLACVLFISWLLGRTRFGSRLYLLGTNAKAAHYAGINTQQILLFTYALCGVLAAISGIISASSASSAKWDYGNSYLLIAILISVMGGINPNGGHGKVIGLVFASIALQMLSSALNLAGMSNFLKDFTWGVLLLASIIFTSQVWRRKPKLA